MFASPDGKPLQYSNWRDRIWLPATNAAGLTGLRYHDLRHTAGTALVAGGTDIKTAQVRLGHANPLTTLRVYAQATHDADRAAAKSLGDLFRPTRSSAPGTADDGHGFTGRHDHRQDPGVVRDGCAIVSYATTSDGPGTPSEQDFRRGARWNRTTDLSIISAAL